MKRACRMYEGNERLLAWARYLYWADLARRQWDQLAEGETGTDEWTEWWAYFARMSHFYATEYVVIEGWREAGFTDSVIDEALHRWPDILALLKRYRNGVFHYQPKLIEERFQGILRNVEPSVFVVHYLHSEFCRYYWSYVNNFPGSDEQRSIWRESILDIVGWVPHDLIEERASQLRQIADEMEVRVQGHEGPDAEEMRRGAAESRALALESVARWREMCREFLTRRSK